MRRYAPIADAAAYAGFASLDHLRALVRRGKVRGRKVGTLLGVDGLRARLDCYADTRHRGTPSRCARGVVVGADGTRYVPDAEAAACAGYAPQSDHLRRMAWAGMVPSVKADVLVDLDDLDLYLRTVKPHMPRGGNSPRPTVPVPASRVFRGR